MTFFPSAESKGGWRVLTDPSQVRSMGEMNPDKLTLAWECNLQSKAEPSPPDQQQWDIPRATSSSVIVIRHGYIVGEWYQNADENTLWDIYSCTKSFTGTAYGLLFQDSNEGKLPGGKHIDLNSSAYSYIPEGYPLSDPRKEQIKIHHLLTMASGIKGEESSIFDFHLVQARKRCGFFELALGHCDTEDGRSVSKLAGTPGTKFDYSDPAFAHLSLILFNVVEIELEDYLKERVLNQLGIENIEWESIGGGNGNISPHTSPFHGIHITARDLARFGYLALKKGFWKDRQIVPRWWMEKATKTSQGLNKSYGYTWWVNTHGNEWKGTPRDTFAAMGYKSNKCYVIPSLDLVIVRVGDGPWPWNDNIFLKKSISSTL